MKKTILAIATLSVSISAQAFDPSDPDIRSYIVTETLKEVDKGDVPYPKAVEWMECQYDSLVDTGESILNDSDLRSVLSHMMLYHTGELEPGDSPFNPSMYEKAMMECGGPLPQVDDESPPASSEPSTTSIGSQQHPDYTSPLGRGEAFKRIGDALYQQKGGVYEHTYFRESVASCTFQMLEVMVMQSPKDAKQKLFVDLVNYWGYTPAERKANLPDNAVRVIGEMYHFCADEAGVPRSMQ